MTQSTVKELASHLTLENGYFFLENGGKERRI
jgi:hypothetical protein